MKAELAQRRITAVTPQLTAAQTHADHIDSNLSDVLRHYTQLIHSGLYEDILHRLPLELRDIVYENLGLSGGTFNAGFGCTSLPVECGYKTAFCDTSPSAFCFDPTVIGPQLATEIADLFFRKTNFRFEISPLLRKSLPESCELRGADSRVPVGYIKNITLTIPPIQYTSGNRLPILIEHMRCLHSLEKKNLVITLEFHMCNWDMRGLKVPLNYTSSMPLDGIREFELVGYNDYVGTFDYTSSKGPGKDSPWYGAFFNFNFRLVLEALAPTLSELSSDWHTIKITDRDSNWTWKSGKGALDVTAIYAARGQHRIVSHSILALAM
jgi:hypothetical protein